MSDLKRVYAAVDEETGNPSARTGTENIQKSRSRRRQTGGNYPRILSIRRRFGR